MTQLEHDPSSTTARDLPTVWEHWWTTLDGTAGEVVWEAHQADLVADLEVFASAFDPGLPVIDLGCGDGRQTRFLARHFVTVLGVDISPSAIARADSNDSTPNVRYRVLDARHAGEAEQLHRELGDANVYVRGMLQALPAGHRPEAVDTIALLLGETGTLFAKELPPEASSYFARLVARHGLSPTLERVMRLIPPGHITEPELLALFSPDRFKLLNAGPSHIHTVNSMPDGEVIKVPAIHALLRPRPSGQLGR